MLLAGYLLFSESFHFALGNHAFMSDLGAALLAVVLGYAAFGLLVGVVVGAFTPSAPTAALIISLAFYVMASLHLFMVRAALLQVPLVAVAFALFTAFAFAALVFALRRWSLPASVPILTVLAYYNLCRSISADWADRGGSLIPFLAAPETLVKVALGALLLPTFLWLFTYQRHRSGLLHAGLLAIFAILVVRQSAASGPASPATVPIEESTSRPDFYVLSFDAMRPDSLQRYVEDHPTSHLAQMMARSMSLENVISDGLATYPILDNNTYGIAAPGHCERSVPGQLAKRGYSTEMLFGRLATRIDSAQCYGRYYSASGMPLAWQYAPLAVWRSLMGDEDASLRDEFLPSDVVLDELQASMAAPQPIFAYLHLLELHAPYVPTSLAGDSAYLDSLRQYMKACYAKACDPEDPENGVVIEAVKEGYAKTYDDIDKLVGRFFQLAEARGRDLVVVLTADHGELFGEHGGFAHSGGFVPELLNIPFVIYDSRRPSPVRRRCELLSSSKALAAVARQLAAGEAIESFRDYERLKLEAEPLGRAMIHRDQNLIEYRINPEMAVHQGTWRNIHQQDAGAIPYRLASCP